MLIKNLNEIIYELKKIENLGYKVSVKPHPRIDQTYEIDLFKKNKIKILNKRTDINLISDKNHYVISSLSSALFYFLKKKKNLLILNTKFIKPIKSYYPIFKYKKTKIIKKIKFISVLSNMISIIIPSKNRHNFLERIIKYYSSIDEKFELIIVDSSKKKKFT